MTQALPGIGTVESRYGYRIGPTSTGRLKRVLVAVGDRVVAGQLLGEMDAVHLDDRVQAQEAKVRLVDAAMGGATARQRYAVAEEGRDAQLLAARSTSAEILAAKPSARRAGVGSRGSEKPLAARAIRRTDQNPACPR